MNWLNIFIPNLRAAEYSRCSPESRATWLNVLAYCCEQENGGVIHDWAKWSEREWLQNCGVTAKEAVECPLLVFNNEYLTVWNYPEEKEKEVQLKRKAGQRGGLAKAANRSAASCASGVLQAELVAETKSATSCAPTEGNGIGSGIGIGTGNETSTSPAPLTPPAIDVGKPSDNRPTSLEAKLVADLFRRRHSTQWSDGEIKTFKRLTKDGTLTVEAMQLIAAWYKVQREHASPDRATYHTDDLTTFLNNFNKFLDRATNNVNPPSAKKTTQAQYVKPGCDRSQPFGTKANHQL